MSIGQGPAAHASRDHLRFRSGLTATLVEAGLADPAGPNCRVVAIEWRRLTGANSYQVQVRVGTRGAWVAAQGDPRCGQDRSVGPTAFRDHVARPALLRYYRVVAVAADGRSLDVTASVPVDVR